MIQTKPDDEAVYLIKYYKTRAAALKHANWALQEVEKPATKVFWKQVIEEIQKLL